MRKTSQAIDGFEDRRGHKPRNAGNVYKLERQENRSPQSLQKNSPANILIILAQSEPFWTSDLQNWKIIIDLRYTLKWNLNVFFKLVICLLISHFWLRQVFVAAHELSPAAARWGSPRVAGLGLLAGEASLSGAHGSRVCGLP